MKRHTVIKVSVDSDECLAHYLCVNEVPTVFEERADVLWVQIKSEVNEQLIRTESERLLWAAAICPVSAIKLTLDTGEIVDGDSELVKEFIASQRKT